MRTRVLVAVVSVATSFVAVRTGTSDVLDRHAAARLTRPLGTRADRAIASATDLGSVYGLTGVAAALALAGHRRLAIDVGAAGLAAWCAAQAAKPLIDRERPYVAGGVDRLVAVPAGSSWPSGHVAVAAAMSGTLAPELPRGAARVADAIVVAIGASRLYVGVHHLSDLVAGWGLGVLSARAWQRGRRGMRGPRGPTPSRHL